MYPRVRGLQCKKVRLKNGSMPSSENCCNRQSLTGPVQTTRSTGGFYSLKHENNPRFCRKEQKVRLQRGDEREKSIAVSLRRKGVLYPEHRFEDFGISAGANFPAPVMRRSGMMPSGTSRASPAQPGGRTVCSGKNGPCFRLEKEKAFTSSPGKTRKPSRPEAVRPLLRAGPMPESPKTACRQEPHLSAGRLQKEGDAYLNRCSKPVQFSRLRSAFALFKGRGIC